MFFWLFKLLNVVSRYRKKNVFTVFWNEVVGVSGATVLILHLLNVFANISFEKNPKMMFFVKNTDEMQKES